MRMDQDPVLLRKFLGMTAQSGTPTSARWLRIGFCWGWFCQAGENVDSGGVFITVLVENVDARFMICNDGLLIV